MNSMSLQNFGSYEIREAYLYRVDKTTVNIEWQRRISGGHDMVMQARSHFKLTLAKLP